LKNTALWQK